MSVTGIRGVEIEGTPEAGATRPDGARPVLALTMSSAMALRNFFQSGVIAELQRDFVVEVLASPMLARTLARLGYDKQVRVTSVDAGPEPWRWRLLRQLKKKVYMEGRASATEAIWEKYQIRPLYQRAGGWLVKHLIRLVNANRLYAWLERLDLAVNRDRRFVPLLREKNVSLFFATHATVFWEESFLRSAIAAGLPCVYMVLSWDHLSSKVLLHRTFARILVWNRHTRDELLATYPTYRPEQIRVVGIPQYDSFRDPPRHTYESWCAQYGLDPRRRTILFSTMPQVRHDQQHVIIEDLLKAIVRGVDVPPDYQVLIKCHPFDNFDGYGALLGRYPVALRRTQLAPGQPIDEWLPSPAEVEESRDCLYFCAININIFSTVTIEAALFDKPVIHIAYDPLPIPPGRIPCHEYYSWEHFRHIVEKYASVLVRSGDELFAAIRRYSVDPSYKAEGRRRVVETYVGDSLGHGAAAVAAALREFDADRAASLAR
jgi:hypothetical protein